MRTITLCLAFLGACNQERISMQESKQLTDNVIKGGKLAGKRIAFLATDGVEQVELTKPRDALKAQGAATQIVSIKAGKIQAFNHHDKGDMLTVDVTLDDAQASQYDALVLPGGVINPDVLRGDARAVQFVKTFANSGRPIAAICHGPWTLVEADVIKGRTLTSWPSLKTDIQNAGGTWVDQAVASDHGLITSRKPDDIAQFVAKIIEEMTEPQHLDARAD